MFKASLRPDTTSSLLRFEPFPPEFCVALLMAFVAWFNKLCPLRLAVIKEHSKEKAAKVFIRFVFEGLRKFMPKIRN
jgi:hypothetical protein